MIAQQQHNTEPKTSTKGVKTFIPPVLVQKKLEIGAADDKYEVEADRMADQVLQMKPVDADKPRPPISSIIQRKCSNCDEEDRIQKQSLSEQITPLVQRKTSNTGGGTVASDAVSTKINQSKGGGHSLDDTTSNFMKTGFGSDFSKVRIHTDSNAINLSRELNAQAFTVGNDIYFNEGKYHPNSNSGKHLLAHELTHTVQQGEENQKVQRFSCQQILNTEEGEGERVGGIRAHNVITNDFKSKFDDRAKGFRIPGATSTPIRLPCGDTPSDYIPPMTFIDQPNTRANVGIPDLAYVDDNRDVHLAEIKIGLHDCRDQAENQVARYVDQANMDDNEMETYKNSPYMQGKLRAMGLNGGGLGDFHLMDPSSVGYTVPDSVMVDSTEVYLGECGNGVIVYKNIGEASDDKHICDVDSDEFIDGLMDRAEEMVDNFLDRHINSIVTQTINNLSLEDMIKLAYEHARPAIRDLVISNAGQLTWDVIESLDDQHAVSALGAYLQNELGNQTIQLLRPIIQQAKSAVIEMIRVRMKEALRGYVQEIMQQLCSENAAVTAAMALAMIQLGIRQLFQSILTEVIQEATIAAATAIAIAAIIMMILIIIAIIVVIVIIIMVLPEILAALGIGGGAVATGGAIGTTATGTALGTTATGAAALGTATIATTGVTATGVTLTVIQGSTTSTVIVANTTATTQVVSLAAATLLSFFVSSGEDNEPSEN